MREWKEKLQRFMIGRYGTDQLARFLSGCILVLLILNLFIRDRILYWLALALLSYCYFRMFSKNISAMAVPGDREAQKMESSSCPGLEVSHL